MARRVLRGVDRTIRSRWFVPVCLLAALAVRVLWVILFDPTPVSDFGWCHARAIDLAAGAGFSADGVPTAFWPIGYPAVLGVLYRLCGPSLLAARLLNALLSTGTLAIVYGITRKLFRSVPTARWTLLILAFYPDQIAFTSILASETLSAFTLLLGILLLLDERLSVRRAALSGFVLGLACLVRPHMIIVPAIVCAVSALGQEGRRRLGAHLRRTLVVYAVLAVTLVPWAVRNYGVFGHLVYVSTNGGIVLYMGNNREATGRYGWSEEMTDEVGSGNEYERDCRARDAAIAYIVSHPRETLRLWPEKLFRLYYRGDEGTRRNIEGMTGCDFYFHSPQEHERILASVGVRAAARMRWLRMVARVSQAYYYTMMAAAAAGLLTLARRRRRRGARFPLHGVFIVLYLTMVHIITFAAPRYHFPMIPWVIMYSGALFSLLTSAVMRERGHSEVDAWG
ncbi:glycosyltransferase family 39 protein [bacterium]|nr:glycosyltransferase family 39 protein [bacterium]